MSCLSSPIWVSLGKKMLFFYKKRDFFEKNTVELALANFRNANMRFFKQKNLE